MNTGKFIKEEVLSGLSRGKTYRMFNYSLRPSVHPKKGRASIQLSVGSCPTIRTLFSRVYPSIIIGYSTLSIPSCYRRRHRRTCTVGISTMRGLTCYYRRRKDQLVRLSASFIFSKEDSHLCARRSLPTPLGCCNIAGCRKRRTMTDVYHGCTVIHIIIICKGTLPKRRNGILRLIGGHLRTKRRVHIITSRCHAPA